MTPEAMTGLFHTVFRAGEFRSYLFTLIEVNGVIKSIIGRGPTLAGNAAIPTPLPFLRPPLAGELREIDIAGTAHRVTIPAIIQVAALRHQHMYGNRVKDVAFT